jgi:folate-binding protein YgfZ
MTTKTDKQTKTHGLRSTGAVFALPSHQVVQVEGKDAERFLHSQTTSDVKSLADADSQMSALLDRKAHVLALFDIYKHGDQFFLVSDNNQAKTIIQQLDAFRFADKVDFKILNGCFFAVQGPRARRLLLSIGVKTAEQLDFHLSELKLLDENVFVFAKTLTGEDGYLIFLDNDRGDTFYQKLKEHAGRLDMVELDEESIEASRIEAGIVAFGLDLTDENLMPETGLDHSHVSYTKGCYQGQEVLARVKSHGAPSRGLVGLVFANDGNSETLPPFAINTEVFLEAQPIGWLRSNCFSKVLNKYVALAYIKREFRIVGKALSVTIDGQPFEIEVALLPLISPATNEKKARELYAQALTLFTAEKDDDETSQAEQLLREALMLNPALEDAYEALGVILSRRNRLDEAVSLMQTLVDLNADSVMAHANLSVFYMQQGLIEKAEEAKAVSMSIRMRMAAKEATRERQHEEEKKRLKEEAQGRMEMFSQVLEIDSEDLLANSGMGNCLVTLEHFEKALPYLQKAIEVKPTHTVAYADLAKAFAGLERKAQAAEILQKGIEVASKRGDMMPLKQMQLQLKELG